MEINPLPDEWTALIRLWIAVAVRHKAAVLVAVLVEESLLL